MANLTHVYEILDNSTRLQTEVHPEEIPIESFIAIAFFMTFIFIVGFAENSFAFFIFYRTKALHTTNNMLIAGLGLCDWCQTVFGMPFVVASSIAKKWIFGQGLCVYYGFITTFMGITQITNLTAISLNKYFAIVRHSNLAFLDPNRAKLAIIACYVHGFLWAIFPVIGWSSYQLEGANVSCSIPWESKETKDVSYCLALSALAWILPLGIITFSYLSILRMLRQQAKKPIRMSITEKSRKRRLKQETSVAITVLIMIGAFIASWMPYSVVSLITIFGPQQMPLTVTMIPALFAKSSIIWNPIIYIARHRDFRKACLKYLKSGLTSQSAESRSASPRTSYRKNVPKDDTVITTERIRSKIYDDKSFKTSMSLSNQSTVEEDIYSGVKEANLVNSDVKKVNVKGNTSYMVLSQNAKDKRSKLKDMKNVALRKREEDKGFEEQKSSSNGTDINIDTKAKDDPLASQSGNQVQTFEADVHCKMVRNSSVQTSFDDNIALKREAMLTSKIHEALQNVKLIFLNVDAKDLDNTAKNVSDVEARTKNISITDMDPNTDTASVGRSVSMDNIFCLQSENKKLASKRIDYVNLHGTRETHV